MINLQLKTAFIAAFCIFAVVAREKDALKSRYLRQLMYAENYEQNGVRLNERKAQERKLSSSKSEVKRSKSSKMPPRSGRKSKSKSSSGSKSSKSSKGGSSKSKSSKSSKSTSRSGSSIKKESKRPTVSPTASPTLRAPMPARVPTPVVVTLCQNRVNRLTEIIRENTDDVSMLDVPNSPQSMAMKWLIEEDELRVCPNKSLKVIQRYALAVFYYSTGGDEWGPSKAPTFLSDSDECDWDGVTCDEDNGVNKLSAVNIGLKGTIPPEIFYIRSLADLQLSEGRLDGSIPEAINKSTRIRTLDLRNQQLSGAIPAVFYDTLLRTVHLDFNQLTGNINGLEKMTNLVSFTASGNQLTGQIPDLTLSNLKTLRLANNNLTGPLPDSLKDLTRWDDLCLQENSFDDRVVEDKCSI